MIETASQLDSSVRYGAQIRAKVLERDKGTNLFTSQKWSKVVTTRIYKDVGQPFRSRLGLSDSRIISPEQDFTLYKMGYHFIIRNHPINQWPSIEIELVASDEHAPLQVVRFDVRPSGNTTDAEILYTRVVFSMVSSGKFSLTLGDEVINFGISKLIPSEEPDFLHRAQLFRKLKFIEKFFNCTFNLPRDISDSDVRQIETVFRGITEGEFILRGDNITFFDYKPNTSDELRNPPFTGVGSFTRNVGEQALILHRVLQVGSVFIRLNHAVVANPYIGKSLPPSGILPQMRVEVLDNQIHHRFEKYVTRHPQLRLKKLKKFKKELLKVEPEELVNLLDHSLQSDVSADEARKTVIGWLDYNQFPDRFWPQQPLLEERHWRVPLSITTPQGQSKWIQDLFVEVKTGSVSSQMSIEELKALGKSIATEMFRAI